MNTNDDLIINKVAQSGILTLDMQDLAADAPIAVLDLATLLEEECILREKRFREKLEQLDTAPYQNAYVAVYCSTDAIIQPWAWMLLMQKLQGTATQAFLCHPDELRTRIVLHKIERELNPTDYTDARVIIKGCGAAWVTPECYLQVTQKLLPVVKSLMYGEPCSTVPVYKKKKQ